MRFEIKISETSFDILFCTCLSLSLKKIVGVFAYIMEMHKIETDKKKYLELLLLADEQESMVDRYLERGDMFVLFSPKMAAIGVAVVTDEMKETVSVSLRTLPCIRIFKDADTGEKWWNFCVIIMAAAIKK